MLEVPKTVPQQAIKNLGAAFQRFFRKQGKYPRFKRKYGRDSFRIDNGPAKVGAHAVSLKGARIKVPKLGWVRMSETLRLYGQVKSAWVSREADEWFVTLVVDTAAPSPAEHVQVIGVDLGIKELAVCSNGQRFANPGVLRILLSRLRRLSKSLSRKKKGSTRRGKARAKLAKLHQRIKNVRLDHLHKTTTSIAETVGAGIVAVEDLNISGMLKNRKLSRALADVGMYEFKRQLTYKIEERGGQIYTVDRFFPSSKTCSSCGHIYDNLTLKDRTWTCPSCRTAHDRDLNAACNLKMAASSAVTARGADIRPLALGLAAAASKREDGKATYR